MPNARVGALPQISSQEDVMYHDHDRGRGGRQHGITMQVSLDADEGSCGTLFRTGARKGSFLSCTPFQFTVLIGRSFMGFSLST